MPCRAMPANTDTAILSFALCAAAASSTQSTTCGIIRHEHEGGVLLREQHSPLDVVDADRLLGPQHALDARTREQLSLGDGGDGQPDGAVRPSDAWPHPRSCGP